MLKPKFKLVNTKTGEERNPSSLKIFDGGGIHASTFSKDGESESISIPPNTQNDWTALQFTGLLDSIGKEIYDGYVLVSQQGTIYKVEFNKGSFYAGVEFLGLVLLSEIHNLLTVIGNVCMSSEDLQTRRREFLDGQ